MHITFRATRSASRLLGADTPFTLNVAHMGIISHIYLMVFVGLRVRCIGMGQTDTQDERTKDRTLLFGNRDHDELPLGGKLLSLTLCVLGR